MNRNTVVKIACFVLVALNLSLASFYVRQGDINFYTDVARDFHLLRELDDKKVILIGPRSSGNLYHGPVWAYLNYPAFVPAHGDPLWLGWYWVFLIWVFTALSFLIAKKLFNTPVAYAYMLMVSLYMVFHARALSHPHGALFILPVFFYTFVRYKQTESTRFLLVHMILAGLLIQFELAVGIPFAVLSFAAILWQIGKTKQWGHLIAFVLFGLTLSNFILFDFRHEHLLFQKLLEFVTPQDKGEFFHYAALITNRVNLMFTSVEILRRDPGYYNFVLTAVASLFLLLQWVEKKYRHIYGSFLYFYAGFFVLSFINKGPILYFHIFPIFPLVFLIFASFLTSRYKQVFLVLFAVIYVFNLANAVNDNTVAQKEIIGKSIVSWKFLYTMAKDIVQSESEAFGYFIYSPDVLAYEPRYAMIYANESLHKQGTEFVKKPVTYLVIAPPPPDNPYMKDSWWRINQIHIDKEPVSRQTYPNGYKVEKYLLTAEEITVAPDPNLNPGLHFR